MQFPPPVEAASRARMNTVTLKELRETAAAFPMMPVTEGRLVPEGETGEGMKG